MSIDAYADSINETSQLVREWLLEHDYPTYEDGVPGILDLEPKEPAFLEDLDPP